MWIIHTVTSAELIKQMLKAGWVLRGVKGSHHVYVHPQRAGHVTVPHPRKDLGTGLLKKLLKQIELDA
jgi:predicted RNA binding protein YcfA (HicA-like mRNA interferase family)